MSAVTPTRTDSLAVLDETRQRTLALVAGMTDEQLARVVTPLLSPLLWDLGHVADFERRMLLDGDDSADGLYDPFVHSRAARGELELPAVEACLERMATVRERVVAVEDRLDPFALELVIQHEQQHNETMLQQLRMMDDYEPPAELRRDEPATGAAFGSPIARGGGRWVEYPSGEYRIGRPRPSAGGFAYDNESSEHTHYLAAFEIAARPVLAGEYREWVEAGHAEPPPDWLRDGDGWLRTGFGEPRPLDEHAPVVHVNWHEAVAYAQAHGARLPTEFEWEAAASYDPIDGAKGRRHDHPWGEAPWSPELANLDQSAFGVRACSRPAGRPVDMIGQVWEWTASSFQAYPGFEPFVYDRYSAPFFGRRFRVLRGGSWATRPRTVDNRFRNWDLPDRRQIFAGLRLARDVVEDE